MKPSSGYPSKAYSTEKDLAYSKTEIASEAHLTSGFATGFVLLDGSPGFVGLAVFPLFVFIKFLS